MTRAIMMFGALVALAAGCGSGATPPPPGAASGAPRDAGPGELNQLAGEPLYQALCKQCHGADGTGYVADRAPSLVSPTFLTSASDEFLHRSIAAGRPGTSMAAYGKQLGGPLDDAAIDRMIGFLRTKGPPAQPLAVMATGDAAAGGAMYGKYCFGCHGDATTRGQAMSLANPQFQAAASDAFIRYAIANGRPGAKPDAKPGMTMEAFGSVLSDAELDGLVGYIRTFGEPGAPRIAQLPPPTGKEPVVLNPTGSAPSFTPRADPCPPRMPSAPPCTPDPRFVSVEQVGKALAAHRRMVIIDARPPSDWMRVHIAGAVSIPYHDMKRLDEIPKDGTWILAYCACPHHLSGVVVDELRKRGYSHAMVLDEGINEWHRRGLPVVAAEGVSPPAAEPALR